MADRVYLHIGAPKSGTTFLQTVLWSNQARLREAGVLLPGQKRGDHNSAAVWARSPTPSRFTQRAWDRVREEIRDWGGPAILSSEWFTMVTPDLAARFVAELAPAEVHVIFTARNLVSTVPAAWQERLKLGDSLELDAFITSLDGTENPRWNWGTLDPSIVLPRWSPLVGPSRIHVVTVPPSGSDRNLLWQRFADACGVAAEVCETDKAFANESISAESARLLQLIGPQLRAAVDADTVGGYLPYRWIRDYLSHKVLAAQRGSKIALRDADLAMLQERSAHLVAKIESDGYAVVGNLNELVGGSVPGGSIRPDQVPDEAVLQLALAVIPPMLGQLRKERERGDREAAKVTRLRAELRKERAASARPAPVTPERPARALVRRIGRRLPAPVRERVKTLTRR